MKHLRTYCKESFDLTKLTDALDIIKDVNDVTDDIADNDLIKDILRGSRSSERRMINNLIQQLINDPDIDAWYESGGRSEFRLRKILYQKLNARELRVLDEIVDKLMEMQ